MGLFEKLGLVTKCVECGSTSGNVKCPHCNAIVCESCLSVLITRKKWPKYFIGQEVRNFNDLQKIINKYKKSLKEQKYHYHICDEFVEYRWKKLEDYKDHLSKRLGGAGAITLK